MHRAPSNRRRGRYVRIRPVTAVSAAVDEADVDVDVGDRNHQLVNGVDDDESESLSSVAALGERATTSERRAGRLVSAANLRAVWWKVGIWYAVLLGVGIAAFGALYFGHTIPAGRSVTKTGNNRSVLMIILDDMRPVQTVYGQRSLGPWATTFTPNLDIFAQQALSFTRAYAQVGCWLLIVGWLVVGWLVVS